MTLESGTKLGRYQVRSQIGAGGIGEVYLARDTDIGRDIAVKVLPSTFSTDGDRLQRFPLAGGKVPVSVGGGSQPRWRRFGKLTWH